MQSDKPAFGTRWSVVVGGFLLTLMGGLAYAWGVFVEPLRDSFGWAKTTALLPLSVLMVVFAIVMIPAGRLQEKYGTQKLIVLGAFLFLIANLLSALIYHIPYGLWLIFTYGVIGGTACGITYSCVAPPIRRWFPDRPGLAVSLGVMGFGIASVVFAPLKAHLIIPNLGLDGTFVVIALLTSTVTLAASRLVSFPTDAWYMHLYGAMHLPDRTGMVRSNLMPDQMLRKPLFWLIWSSFLLIIYGSLLIIGMLPSYGKDVVKLTPSEAAIPLSLFALVNGLSRPVSGFISDKIGILKIMFVVYLLQALVFFAFPFYMVDFISLNIASVILGLGIGTALALYPVLTSECFGVEHLGANYGIVFSAYGFGAIAIQGGAYLKDLTGSYTPALLIAGVMSLISTIIIFFIRKKYKLS